MDVDKHTYALPAHLWTMGQTKWHTQQKQAHKSGGTWMGMNGLTGPSGMVWYRGTRKQGMGGAQWAGNPMYWQACQRQVLAKEKGQQKPATKTTKKNKKMQARGKPL